MRHWLQLGTRNWRASPGRTVTTVLAITLSVGMVVWMTCCYESLQRTVNDWVWKWVGRSHLSVESPLGKWGNFTYRVAGVLADEAGVEDLAQRLWWRVYAEATSADGGKVLYELDVTGIEAPAEYAFRDLREDIVAGRALEDGEQGKVVLEASWAKELGFGVGDTLWFRHKRNEAGTGFEIVGLADRTRINRFQRPTAFVALGDFQTLTDRPGLVTTVDLRLKDFSLERVRERQEYYRDLLRTVTRDVVVKSSEEKLRQLRVAQRHMEIEISSLSCIAFLTAFFIILSTMSMGMVERVGQMGLLRCLGLTRWQLGVLVPLEVIPLGAVGVCLGVPLGFWMVWMTTQLVPDYVGRMAISSLGMVLAVVGGMATALLGAAVPMARVLSVSPLSASRATAESRRPWLVGAAAALGASLIGVQFLIAYGLSPELRIYHAAVVFSGLILYVGYALLAPGLVLVLGGVAVRGVALVLGLNRRLLRDQVSRVPWRGGGICAGLMVGLSLIVCLLVYSEGIVQGWQFPKQFPEAFAYSFRSYPLETLEEIRGIPGVGRTLAVQEFNCEIDNPRSGLLRWLKPSQRFVAADVDRFPDIVRLSYLEGDAESALEQLRAGTGVLLTREFMRTYDKHAGDSIVIRSGDVEATFTVAGVVASPSLDIAVEFFRAGGEFQMMSVGCVIGTMAQAEEFFGQRAFRLLVFDFDLPEAPIPAGTERVLRKRNGLPDDAELAPEQLAVLGQAWKSDRERRVFAQIEGILADGHVQTGSVSRLKDLIDGEIRQVTRILTAIPALALIVGALGVGNLMMANVNSRARQIAALRAIGATKWQIGRLVLGEAGVLAVIGCALGLALGFHLAWMSNFTTDQLLGLRPAWVVPWGWVGFGAGFTSLICLVAGLAPAWRAARNDIISAMQAT